MVDNLKYSFTVSVAKEVGVDGAIMLENLHYWIIVNKAKHKEDHFHDGEYWTFNTKKGFSELFPFWTERQVRRILDNLIKDGYIKTGNYNKLSFDRTLWYTLTEKGWLLFGIMQKTEPSNDNGQNSPMTSDRNVQTIPYNKPNNKTNNNTTKEPRHKYGEFKNVLLSDKDLEKLKTEYGEELVEKYIKKMDEWIELNGRRYKNYYLALRQWMNKEVSKKQEKVEKQEGDTKYYEEYFTNLMEQTLRGGKLE